MPVGGDHLHAVDGGVLGDAVLKATNSGCDVCAVAIVIIVGTTADTQARWKASKTVDGSALEVSVLHDDARADDVDVSARPSVWIDGFPLECDVK